ncbi:MAG TPA: TolC family protein, partial [Polyangiaceae bacterium]|nr:TolC family protein [Polyangiaceae bacterium]
MVALKADDEPSETARRYCGARRRRCASGRALILLSLLSLAQQARGQAGAAPPDNSPPSAAAAAPADISERPLERAHPGLSLRRCLELAERNYPKIQEARARLAAKRAQLEQAHFTPYSDFTATGGLTLAPDVRGTNIYSPDSDVPVKSDMGVAWQAGIQGLIPLWTFGKITNLWDAAEAQVKVGEHEVQKEKNQLRYDVRHAYYGVQLARDALALVHDGLARLDKYLPDLEKRVAAGDADDIDLLKLRMNHA